MKLVLAFILLIGMSSSAFAGEKKCATGYKKFSCEKVSDSKRESFCWYEKRKISNKKIERICKTSKKKKRK